MNSGKRDWFRFWLHFGCGTVLGAGVGFYFWGRHYRGSGFWPTGAVCIAGGALLFGLAGGFGDDDFWGSLGRWRRW